MSLLVPAGKRRPHRPGNPRRVHRLTAGDLDAIDAAYVDARDYAERQGDADPERFARRYAGLIRWALLNRRPDVKSVADFYVEAHE